MLSFALINATNKILAIQIAAMRSNFTIHSPSNNKLCGHLMLLSPLIQILTIDESYFMSALL